MALHTILGLVALSMTAPHGSAADPERLAQEEALLQSLAIQPDELKPLALETALVEEGKARAVICHADAAPWQEAARTIQQAVAEATGVTIPTVTDAEMDDQQADGQNLILLGHLDNHRIVARLYHNFLVCLDTGYTGREGYVIRSVHNPFGDGWNYILVGGSFPEGTRKAAEAFAGLVRENARPGSLALGRLLELRFDAVDRAEPAVKPMTEADRDQASQRGRDLLFSPGQGRSGVSQVVNYGLRYHRTGDPFALETYRALMFALLEYFETDEYINSEGMRRYDRDFRDAWTHRVAIPWDLTEESGAFSDEERLAVTNLLIRLALECELYQRWDREGAVERWAENDDIVHNHNTFPALGAYFVGNYMKRHYGLEHADRWLAVAHGIFNGQKHCSKPLEDAAAYQWLPIIHTMVYSLAEGDLAFFEEGHARDSARVAIMVMDNAGYQAAFGDHSAYKSSSGIGTTLQKIAWYYKDPGLLWAARHATGSPSHPLDQPYHFDLEPRRPAGHEGLAVSYLPGRCYDYAARSPQYATAPNLPLEQTFDKLAFRAGWEPDDEYMLLDGFGRGTHMHFDANAIIRYAAGGEPLLVDGEYIKNAPKYHSSLVIIRDGQAELTPAVTGLGRADNLDRVAFTQTYLTQYNGAEWRRDIVWVRDAYFLIGDTVTALEAGDFTLRCCWRPWGEAALDGGTCTVEHPPMRMMIANADGAACRLEEMKVSEMLPISRLSQQVSRHLDPGQSYRFVNLLHSHPSETTRDVTVRRVGDGLVVVARGEASDVVAFGPGPDSLPGVDCAADALVLTGDHLAAAGCTRLAAGADLISASKPVSVELVPAAGTGALVAAEETQVKLRLKPGSSLTISDRQAEADNAGLAEVTVAPGRHVLEFDPLAMPPELVQAAAEVAKLPALPAEAGQQAERPPQLNRVWSHAGFEPPTETLKVVSVECGEPHNGRYGPVEKLFDGHFSSSTHSVMWSQGVPATIMGELAAEAEISSVVLREWHMNSGWDIGERQLEISSDGFADDTRTVEAPFEMTGTQKWGGNVNTLMEAKVGQKARQVRLTVSPARDDSSVYLAEVQIHGTRPGAAPEIRCIATGDLTGDGRDEIVVCSDGGEISALTADGDELWTFSSDERAAINSLACADVDGDGRAEVIYGANGARLGLLSADGKELWHVQPPEFRGISSDVITVLPADVDGDGLPEIVCGCKSWQYFAYGADGEVLWQNVIYAHSATVGWADDFDGDGAMEVIGGNAYYTLNLIDHDGQRIYSRDRLGPEQTAVSSADVDGDGLPEILMGTDAGEVICYDGDGSRIWATNVGDKVTRMIPVDLTGDGTPEIVCAAESAHLFALRADGTTLWRRPLPDGVGDVCVRTGEGPPLLLATAGSAGAMIVDAEGNVVAAARTGGRAQSVVECWGRAVVTTSEGTAESFDVPQP